MSARHAALVCAFGATGALATDANVAANPIRKVVNLLQAMQKKVTAEGAEAEEMHKKFMCYCSSSGSALSASVSAAEAKIPEVQSAIKTASAKKVQLTADLKEHQQDRDAAKAAMASATSLRSKEKATFDASLADNKQNLAALAGAIAAIDQGMAGSFVQTQTAATLRALVVGKQEMLNADRQDILAFLAGKQGTGYAPASGEISGILKTMHDEMSVDQTNLISAEDTAVKTYEGLMAAKTKEVAALSKSIEEKTGRVGDLGVEIATMKNDLEDTSEGLAQDQAFAADLKANCASREGIHQKEKQLRADEVVALADTIKILNDDDALELFKKTLPSASSSFLQVQGKAAARRERAQEVLSKLPGQHRRLDFVLLALRGRKVGFDKIAKMIDNLVATLKTEQSDDEHKKEYCEAQFDHADDKKKSLSRSISDLETVIEETKESLATMAEEISALRAGIAALDKSVAGATEQRKAEAAEYKDLMSSNNAAKELILFAKNRLNKFYNPKLHKKAAARELSEDDRIYENQGGDIPTEAPGGIAGTGIASLAQLAKRDAPAPPPATAAAYVKKASESGGVMAMMDLLVADLDKEMTAAETDEKNAQTEYTKTMEESASKRTQDSKSLTDKEAAKADLESSLERSTADKAGAAKELMGTMAYIGSLKAECDWLLQYFDVRKEARSGEIDSLEKAKAVLAGADFSFLQHTDATRARKFLQRA